MGKLTKDKDGTKMNEYNIILVNTDTKTENSCAIVVGEKHEILKNMLSIFANNKIFSIFRNVIKIKEIEKKEFKDIEKSYRVYTYIPKLSDIVINKYCDVCSNITKHDVFFQYDNVIGNYRCSKCNKHIFSDIIVETLSGEEAKYTPPSNLLDLINSKFDFKSEERYWLKAGDILKELNVQDQDITALQISIILRGNRIMPKSFLNKNYYPMPQLIGDDSFCNRYDKVE